jgi:hypothetical protein
LCREAAPFIPRRDTGASVNALVGGRLFPGHHHRARFRVRESDRAAQVAFDSVDAAASVSVEVSVDGRFDSGVFRRADEASRFFQQGAIGYSTTRSCDQFDGLELRSDAWSVEATQAVDVRSSFFDDPQLFPPGIATLDCALLMRDVPVTWHAMQGIRSSSRERAAIIAR